MQTKPLPDAARAARQGPGRPWRRFWPGPDLAAAFCLFGALAAADDTQYEQEPIRYSDDALDDPVARLAGRLERGEERLEFDARHGWLPSLLARLNVPVESQTLVFSKTSFQRDRISPETPRALYFNDDVYVGWVPMGEVVEISAVDPHKGAIFYTLEQSLREGPRFRRQTHDCLQCHDGIHSQRVPGHIMRSVHVDSDGQLVLNAGSFTTHDQSLFHERYGGWYVTGLPATAAHLGNQVLSGGQSQPTGAARDQQRVPRALPLCDTRPYLSGGSDIVALLVLGHQVTVHNLITRANYQTRLALRDERAINQALGRPPDHRLESTTSRIASAGDALARALLLTGEARLPEGLSAEGAYARVFQEFGPFDRQGRSLRELDLRRQLFRYPLSYLIYSRSFDELPEPVQNYVYGRLWQVLTSDVAVPGFAAPPVEQRRAIIEILRDTKPNLPPSWRAAASAP